MRKCQVTNWVAKNKLNAHLQVMLLVELHSISGDFTILSNIYIFSFANILQTIILEIFFVKITNIDI